MKMFTNQGEYRAMQAEMQTIKALKVHPNIVHFLEVGEVEVKIKKFNVSCSTFGWGQILVN